MSPNDMVAVAVLAAEAAFERLAGGRDGRVWLEDLGPAGDDPVDLAARVVLGAKMSAEDLYLQVAGHGGVAEAPSKPLLAALTAFMAVVRALEPLRCRWRAEDVTGVVQRTNVVPLGRRI